MKHVVFEQIYTIWVHVAEEDGLCRYCDDLLTTFPPRVDAPKV